MNSVDVGEISLLGEVLKTDSEEAAGSSNGSSSDVVFSRLSGEVSSSTADNVKHINVG